MNRFSYAILSVILATIAGCGDSGKRHSVDTAGVDACISRGVQYFKDIDSYPTLKSEPNIGRRAEEVAAERCKRTLTAF
jgi:hypothetical protein